MALAWNKHEAVQDWFLLRNYSPPNSIVKLATQDTMTDKAKHLLYINHPLIQDRSAFNKSCAGNGQEQTIVLGCYHGGESGIFLFQVKDAKLNGVMQVTIAHEVLHAAYERLSSAKRAQINKLLLDYYSNHLDDRRILKTISAYKKSEPNDVVNEMHSIFGTEILDLPTELEQYYKQYFTNRRQIATYAQNYEGVFTKERQQVQQYDEQLASLKAQIDNNESQLTTKLTALNNQQAEMRQLIAHKQYTAYNAQVNDFNSKAASYNILASTTRDLINQYNNLLEIRNNLVVQQNLLLKSIDSRPSLVKSQ